MYKLDSKAIFPLMIGPFIVVTILSFIVLLVALEDHSGVGTIWITALGIGLFLGLLIARVRYKSYSYELDDIGFKYHYGLFRKSSDIIPYKDIKEVRVKRGLLGRMLGLSYLAIAVETDFNKEEPSSRSFGNVMGVGAELPGLSKNVAEQLRETLMNRKLQKQ